MTTTIDKERTRLFTLDEELRQEADDILKRSGAGKILTKAGFHLVGSYAMKTMIMRNLDFERYDDNPDCDTQWALGQEFAKLEWVWSVHCNESYKDPQFPDASGLYWGIKLADPEGGNLWTIDLWAAPRSHFERSMPKRQLWMERIDDDTRYTILAIKDALAADPEFRKSIYTLDIYEAVLEQGITGLEEFRKWMDKKRKAS